MDTEEKITFESGLLDSAGFERLRQQLELVNQHPAAFYAVELTYQEAAYLLKVSPRTIRRFVASGDLEAIWLGGKKMSPRIALLELERFLERSPKVNDAG
jgi:excisionase family DNA binding protein